MQRRKFEIWLPEETPKSLDELFINAALYDRIWDYYGEDIQVDVYGCDGEN